jgi:hypothetical protein
LGEASENAAAGLTVARDLRRDQAGECRSAQVIRHDFVIVVMTSARDGEGVTKSHTRERDDAMCRGEERFR